MLGPLRQRFASARAADAPELEQVAVRFALLLATIGYLLVLYSQDGSFARHEMEALAVCSFFILPGTAHLVWVLARPGVNHVRRHAVVLLDNTNITAMLLAAGEEGAMVHWMYLWVCAGNGFRYGRYYLHLSQALALAGMTIVCLASAYWRQHAAVSVAILLSLIAIPWYAGLLISRLHATTKRLDEARSAAEAANIAKTKFLGAASHDLRQPMQALSMYASVLEERVVADPNALRVIRGIRLSVTTLEQLFDSLLDISRIESGVIQPNIVAFPLMPLIERVVEAEKPLAAQKGLEVRTVPTSISVSSDPALLERMLKNLVTNAIRYTDRGRIVVGCRRVTAARVRLEVLDSGIGIALQEQERIFDEYYQLSGSSPQGLGLGLPIVKSLGLLLGHAIAVRSAVGRGSAFSIELYRAAGSASAFDPGHLPVVSLEGINVVLVDDDAEIRESVRMLLENWRCCCIEGATVAEIEDKLHARRITPDALIVDYRLVDAMTGLQVIERLRARFGAALPALIITGTPNATLLQQQAAGIPFALKPLSPGKLRAFLSQIPRAQVPANPDEAGNIISGDARLRVRL